MRRALAIVAAALLVPVMNAAADEAKALSDYKAGRYLEAVAELQAVIDRSPGNASAYFLMGQCLLKMRRPSDAEAQFRRAVEIDPLPEYFQGLAVALKTGADYERAIQSASDGLARATDPGMTFSLLVVRGYTYRLVNRWAEAARDLESARRIRSEPWLSLVLGQTYFALGAYDRAAAPLRDALAAIPDEPEALRLLAVGDVIRAGAEADPARKRLLYAEALGYARRLAAARPGDIDAAYLVGRAALGAGELLQAEALFRHVLAVQPRQCYAMVNLGRTYLTLGRFDEAETQLQKAAVCAPRMASVFDTLGDLYMKQGLPQRAADAYARAQGLEPEQFAPSIPVRGPR